MLKSVRIRCGFFLLCLLGTQPVVPSNNWASVCSTGLENILSFAMLGFALKTQVQAHMRAELPDASPQATEFVREQLKLHNVPHYRDIKIKVGTNYEAVSDAVIMLLGNQKDPGLTYLDDILDECRLGDTAEIRQNAEYTLLILKAVLSHEIQHLMHNDSKKSNYAQIALPLITYGGTRLIEELIKAVLPKSLFPERVPSYLENGYKIFKGISRATVNAVVYLKLTRYFEQRADDGILSDAKILEAFKEFLYSINAQVRESVMATEGNRAVELFDTNRIVYEMQNFVIDPEHPSPLTRIKKVDERLAKLQSASPESA